MRLPHTQRQETLAALYIGVGVTVLTQPGELTDSQWTPPCVLCVFTFAKKKRIWNFE